VTVVAAGEQAGELTGLRKEGALQESEEVFGFGFLSGGERDVGHRGLRVRKGREDFRETHGRLLM